MNTFLLERIYACKICFCLGYGRSSFVPKELCRPSERPDGIELKETQDVQTCANLYHGVKLSSDFHRSHL